MKQIEAFVDDVYQGVGGNRKEIQELKAEMKSHLLDAVHELKAEGKTEQEAIEIAIERFGGEKEIRSIVGQLFKAQRTFAKWVLYTALIFLLISFIGYFVINKLENSQRNEIYQVSSQILDSLGNTITEQTKTDIQKVVQENENITGVSISAIEATYVGNDTFYTTVSGVPEYSFREKPIFNHFITYRADGTGNENWAITVELKSYVEAAYTALFLSVCIFWVLFAIWAIINVYHRKGFNLGWALAFIIFNVLGYLVFKLSERFRIIISLKRVS